MASQSDSGGQGSHFSTFRYWKKYLADVELCYFPIIDERNASLRVERSVDVLIDDVAQLQYVCSNHHVSIVDIFQTTWALVLHCYLRQNVACFGCMTFTDGGKEGLPNSAGGRTDMLLCRVPILNTDTVIEIVNRVQEEYHHCAPYRFRVPSGTYGALHDSETFVNTAMALQNSISPVSAVGGITFREASGLELTQYDILINIVDFGNRVKVTLDYWAPRVSDDQAIHLAHTFKKVFLSVLANPDQMVGDLDVLSELDKAQIWAWNQSFPEEIDSCVHELVEQQAHLWPHSPAICSWDGKLSYCELEDLSTRLAHHLVDFGVGPEMPVPLFFEKSMWAIVAMLGILKAGGVCVPLNTLHPMARLEHIIRDVGAELVLVSKGYCRQFEHIGKTVVVSPTLFNELPKEENVTQTATQPANLAFVVFTSGSTGRPKGIMLEHRSVCSSARARATAIGIGHGSRVLQFAAYAFDVSISDIFITLTHGGCVCVPSEYDRLNNLTKAINAMMVNQAQLTPTVAELLLPSELPSLKTLSLGGELMKPGNVTTWAENVCLNNVYGPSECTIDCAVNPRLQVDSNPASIGQGMGALLWITDPSNHDRLAPIGSVGELLVEGPVVARGYLNDVEKTAAAFITNPAWIPENGSGQKRRIYKTGDLVRYGSNGSITFVGRRDAQIKLRGQRIEIGEVEYNLSKTEVAALSLVVLPKKGPYSGKLVTVLQLRSSSCELPNESEGIRLVSKAGMEAARIGISQICTYLNKQLPQSMIPTIWICVEKIPLLASAKIDRLKVGTWLEDLDLDELCAISENSVSIGQRITDDEPIALAISKKVASLVAVGNMGLQSALKGQDVILCLAGLDSITSITLVEFIRRNYHVNVGIEKFFGGETTIRGLAEHIKRLMLGSSEESSKLDIIAEVRALDDQLLGFLGQPGTALQLAPEGIRNIFVTGTTGFLGTQILRQLLALDRIEKVIAHVRGNSVEHATQRLVTSAKLAGWWSDSFFERLEVWLGDLTESKLGLTEQQWSRISGCSQPHERINAIIHNGAAVYWNADYHTLKHVNVLSTVHLLVAAATSSSMLKFIYVSGGHFRRDGEANESIAAHLSSSNGYSQTKFVSELLIEEVARKSTESYCKFLIIKPGIIIGTAQEGKANVDDFLWRLVAGVVNIRSYDIDTAESWLFISDVERVANEVLDNLLDNSGKTHVRQEILDGITLQEFWDVLTRRLGYDLRPTSHNNLLAALYKDIELNGELHPLWPLLPSLQQAYTSLGRKKPVLGNLSFRTEGIKKAIKRNVEYLISIGFLPQPGGKKLPIIEIEVFRRSKNGWLPKSITKT